MLFSVKDLNPQHHHHYQTQEGYNFIIYAKFFLTPLCIPFKGHDTTSLLSFHLRFLLRFLSSLIFHCPICHPSHTQHHLLLQLHCFWQYTRACCIFCHVFHYCHLISTLLFFTTTLSNHSMSLCPYHYHIQLCCWYLPSPFSYVHEHSINHPG